MMCCNKQQCQQKDPDNWGMSFCQRILIYKRLHCFVWEIRGLFGNRSNLFWKLGLSCCISTLGDKASPTLVFFDFHTALSMCKRQLEYKADKIIKWASKGFKDMSHLKRVPPCFPLAWLFTFQTPLLTPLLGWRGLDLWNQLIIEF